MGGYKGVGWDRRLGDLRLWEGVGLVGTGRKIMLSVLVNLFVFLQTREGLAFFPAQKMPIYFFIFF